MMDLHLHVLQNVVRSMQQDVKNYLLQIIHFLLHTGVIGNVLHSDDIAGKEQ